MVPDAPRGVPPGSATRRLIAIRPRAVGASGVLFGELVGDRDAFIRLLRSKVEGVSGPRLIHTVRGVGYVARQEELE